MKQTYYEILGVERNATADDISKAYKELAKKMHPDKNKEHNASEKFAEITAAYKVLSDPESRKRYDIFGSNGPNISGFSGMNPADLFNEIIKNMNNMDNDDVPSIEVSVKVTLEEIYSGTKKKIDFERYTLCTECSGRGANCDDPCCTECNGVGTTFKQVKQRMMQTQCKKCKGTGIDPNAPICKKCNGKTCFKETHSATIVIEKGVTSNTPIVISNEGNEIPVNERRGKNNRTDVLCFIDEISHNKFRRGSILLDIKDRNENNLWFELKLHLEEALCGFRKVFTHLDGKRFEFGLSEPVKNGAIYVLKGQGMPLYQSNEKGDMLIKINVEMPNISLKQKKEIWSLFSKEPFTEIRKSTNGVITLEEYKKNVVEDQHSERLRNKYKGKKTNIRRNDDDDDEDDDESGEECGCVQQ